MDLSGAVAAARAAGWTYQVPLRPECVSIIIGMQTLNRDWLSRLTEELDLVVQVSLYSQGLEDGAELSWDTGVAFFTAAEGQLQLRFQGPSRDGGFWVRATST